MESNQMLHEMCRDVLTNVDIKAIRKSRGFSDQETATSALLENFFLTEIGVEQAMTQLTRDEIITLHLLKLGESEVGVDFFERLYGPKPDAKGKQRYYSRRTFTQRYQDVFKSVRTSLVRRGLLLMAESGFGEAKMERWRFRLPEQFERFLPPFLSDTHHYSDTGTFNQTLSIQGSKFRANLFQESLQKRWVLELAIRSETSITKGPKWINCVEALLYLLEQLGPDEWLWDQELEEIIYFLSGPVSAYSYRAITVADLCEKGWKWGQLIRHTKAGNNYYRLAPQAIVDQDPADYLSTGHHSSLVFDMKTIPVDSLEQIVCTSDIVRDGETLLAEPNLIKMGRASAATRAHPVVQWLQQQLPTYAQALEKVEKEWGKQVVHSNLLIAKVNDLSLKVAIERAFAKKNMPEIQQLPNDYIAFPRAALSKIEQVVRKAGHVVKTVNSEQL